MILKIDSLQEVCNAIIPAVEASNVSTLSETLELEVKNKVLYMYVTNREYFVQVKLPVTEENDFKATVNANLFLKLVSQTTTDNIELNVEDKALVVKGNGTYKIPLIYNGEDILELPRIEVENVTTTFDMQGKILADILKYNLKQLSTGKISRPVQKLFYVDEKGALTFTSGACVNSFTLPQPVKIFLNQRLVKLFKLFKDDVVKFELGHTALDEETMQTRVKFETDSITITAILAFDDTLFTGVPVDAIRGMATQVYDYSVVIDKDIFMNAINRMKIFVDNATFDVKFKFDNVGLHISDYQDNNTELIKYQNEVTSFTEPYAAILNVNDFIAVLDTCVEKYVTLNFGNHKAFTLARGSVVNIVPEVIIS